MRCVIVLPYGVFNKCIDNWDCFPTNYFRRKRVLSF